MDTQGQPDPPGEWVLLSYRMPREPSTPRIAIWRKLKRLGAAQISDGLVALPADARTREQFDWVADEILAAGGTAGVWLAQPATVAEGRRLAQTMADARSAEYAAVLTEAVQARGLSEPERLRALRKLRSELRRIRRRDYFPPPERRAATDAVDALRPDHDDEETA